MDTSDTTKSRESTEATIPTAANPTGMHPTVTHPGTVHPGTVHSSTVHPTSANPVFPTSFLVWTDAEPSTLPRRSFTPVPRRRRA